MKLTLVAVGRGKRGPETDLFTHYCGRLRPSLTLIEVEERRPLSGSELMAREATLISAKIPDGAYVVAMDERGKALKSRDFANMMQARQDDGIRELVFIIGGADGLDPALRARADLTLCFGPQTWPHMLVRGMLAEQLYRAQSIHAGHPYHRD